MEVSLILLIEPVLNPIWAWIVHGERPGAWALLGGAALLAATAAKSLWEARVESRRGSRAGSGVGPLVG